MIRGRIGVVREVEDPFADGLGRGFARVKVAMDIRKPMVKELQSRKSTGEPFKLSLRYEKLQDLCYCCGRIGHSFRGCNDYVSNPVLNFDKSMKVPPIRSMLSVKKNQVENIDSMINNSNKDNTARFNGIKNLVVGIVRANEVGSSDGLT